MNYDIIMNMISTWGPGVVAIIGIIATAVQLLRKIKETYDLLKGDNYQKSLEESNKQLKAEIEDMIKANQLKMDALINQNMQLIRDNQDLKYLNRKIVSELKGVIYDDRHDSKL